MSKINSYIKIYSAICEEKNIDYEYFAPFKRAMVLTKKDGNPAFIYKSATPLNNHTSRIVSHSKVFTVAFLKQAGVPTSEQYRVKTLEDLTALHTKMQNIVVKPADSKGGNGVTMLPNSSELEQAFLFAKKYSNIIIVEKYIPGENYRFLVLDDKVLSVVHRDPPFVIGDGSSTVATLIEDKNLIDSQKGVPSIKLSAETLRVLKHQNVTPSTILEKGKKVVVRLTGNLSKGATAKDITDSIPEEHKKIAIEGAKAIGLRLAGVDIICNDIYSPISTPTIIEINATPGLKMHYFEEIGKKRNIAQYIIDAIYNS
jgi:D-alanine-D-alanine ligase-like ATP-grasp enzyme